MALNIMFLLILAAAPQGSERVLDLSRPVKTAPTYDEPFRYEGSCQGRGSSGRVHPSPPLAIAIESLNSADYSMGGLIVAHLRLTNRSSEPLVFPSALIHEFGENFIGFDMVQVALTISGVDTNGKHHTLTGTILRGSAKRPGTLQQLGPGESIKVRFPSSIMIVDGPSAPPSGEMQVYASIIYNDGECRSWAPAQSSATKIQFRGTQ